MAHPLMHAGLPWAVALFTAVAMEGWAAWMHGDLWHGSLWPTHRSHHRGKGDVAHTSDRRGPWELNDLFGLAHAAVATPLIYFGMADLASLTSRIMLGIGAGMTVFGAAYALVHDGFVHGRLPVDWFGRSRFLRRVAAAHRVHHRTGGAPYGLFTGPWVLRRASRARAARRALPMSAQASNVVPISHQAPQGANHEPTCCHKIAASN